MEKNKSKRIGGMENSKGITLLALAVTIVVLLILTSIGIKLALGNSGIIGEAKNAKEQAEFDEEKGIVKRVTTVSLIKSKGSKVEKDTLEKALNDETGEGKTEVNDVGDAFEVVFVDSNRYYEVDEDGNISDVNKITKDDYAGDITKGGKCDGSEEKPYEISCIEDLVVLSNITNGTGIKIENGVAVSVTTRDAFNGKYIVLTRDLNFKSKYSYDNYSRIDFGNLNGDDTDGNSLMTEMTTGSGFVPIGDERKNSGYSNFQGNFNGNNNEIKNLYQESNGLLGLFGQVNASDTVEIKNLTISGNIKKKSNTVMYSAAGLIGNFYGKLCNIENITNYVDVFSEQGSIGGVVGYTTTPNGMKIKNCKNHGKIINLNSTNNMNESAGGIIGFVYSGNVEIVNCVNYGNISGNDAYAYDGTGGIIGGCWSANVNIYNTCNYGKIEGNYRIGGIAGTMHLDAGKSFNFINVINVGNVLATNPYAIGGILGTKSSTSTTNKTINVFYLSKNDRGIGAGMEDTTIGYTASEMMEGALIEKLNEYINSEKKDDSTDRWKKWKQSEKGYPILED